MDDSPPLLSTDKAVVCKGVKKSFGEGALRFEVLARIDLTVNQGELLMLIGPSGSGKTTLISIIAGILSQDEGECLLFNYPINQVTERARTMFRKRRIGYLFQTFNLIPTLSSVENVAVPLLIQEWPRQEAYARAREILIDLGLKGRLSTCPHQLSGGEKQRLAIGRAMIHEPNLIVCDEPTSALDQANGRLVLEQMRHIVDQKGCSMILVTHDNRIFDFADRIVKIENGYLKEAL